MDTAQAIRNKLNMEDVARFYGYAANRSGFIKCPFHSDKTASLKIYSAGRGWSCFGCNSHGSVIDFVMKLYGLGFQQAATKLDEDFRLGLTSKKLSRVDLIRIEKQKARNELIKQQAQKTKDKYWGVFAEWKRLDDNKRNYFPRNPEEEPHPLFIEALQKIASQEFKLDLAELTR